MSYTIKSLQKALTLLEDEFQELGTAPHTKNHIHDMYLEFRQIAEKLSDQQANDKNSVTPEL